MDVIMTFVLIIGVACLVIYNVEKTHDKLSLKVKLNLIKAGIMLTTASITYLIVGMFV